MTGWYQRFNPGYAGISAPLENLLKMGRTYSWKEEQETSWSLLKEKLSTAPVLAYPMLENGFRLYTDASDLAVGAVLANQDNRPICFLSRKFNKAELNYSTYEKELLAVVFALKKLRHYLLGQQFDLYTDNNAVRHLVNKADPNARICRWILAIMEFNFAIHHLPGSANVTADYLSRFPSLESATGVDTEEIYFTEHSTTEYEEELTQIINFLVEPDWTNEKDKLKKLYIKTRRYFIHKDRLFRLTKDGIQWVVPKGKRRDVLQECHDGMAHL